jgi:hypothetical protein
MLRMARRETFANEFVCFVRLNADSGLVGWGQTSTCNADITARIFHRQVAPAGARSQLRAVPAAGAPLERCTTMASTAMAQTITALEGRSVRTDSASPTR